jgi:hypothetical protein
MVIRGGFSFPSALGRLLLVPDPVEGGVSGAASADPAAGASSANTPPPSDGIGGGGIGSGITSGQAAPGERPSFRPDEGSSTAAAGAGGRVDAPPATPADPNIAAGAQAAATAAPGTAASEWQGIRDAARAYGYDLSRFNDDGQALLHLIQQAQASRQADYYAQLGRQLAPHAQGIQTYLQQQAQAAQQQKPQPWQAPEFDDRWLALVDRDPATGVFVAKQGVNPAIADRVNAYDQWMRNWQTKGPEYVEQIVDSRLQGRVDQMVQERLAGYQREQTIQSIVAQHADWLYQTDQTGRRLTDVNGQFVPTPAGARYVQNVRTLQGLGVTDPRAQDQLARQLLMGEIAMGQASQANAQVSPQAAAAQAVARPQVNPLQAQPPQQRALNPAATEPSSEGLTLQEMIRREFRAAGVTDADFAPAE